MSLKTRIDARSKKNNSFQLKDDKGTTLAYIKLLGSKGVNLQITTQSGIYIEKPSGWNSKK